LVLVVVVVVVIVVVVVLLLLLRHLRLITFVINLLSLLPVCHCYQSLSQNTFIVGLCGDTVVRFMWCSV